MQMTPRAARPRFLLVEDDIISRGFFKSALETLPADVDTADSLASALASAEPGAHDLWLIDVNLPDGRSGYNFSVTLEWEACRLGTRRTRT